MTAKSLSLLKRVGKSWVALSAILVLGLMIARGTPLWAATVRELNQTVPPPTATKLPTPIPPATATPKPPSNSGGEQKPSSQPTNTPEPSAPKSEKLTGTVKSNSLNVRSGPGTGYLVIGVLKQGDKVEIIEQNTKGDWWRICCLEDTEIRGWVSTNFITPDFDVATSDKLLPVATNVPAPPTPTPTEPAPVSENTNAAAAEATNIKVVYFQSPAFPIQGMVVTAAITVTNPTGEDAIDVELRDELPKGMTIVAIETSEIAIVTQDVTENLREVYSILWPTLASGEVVTATARLRIDPTLPNGTVLDNLVFAGASNIEGSTAGISIGMPPVDLPDFQ